MNSRFAAIPCGVWIMVIGTLSGALAAQQVDLSMVQTPNAQEVLATLRKEHPRVLATKESFDALRERVRTDARSKVWYGKLRAQAEKLLDQPPVKYELPDGMRLLSVSREVVHRTELLGLVWQVGHKDRFADRLWRELQTVAKFDDWHPPHFLDTAEMTFAVGVGYDWLYEHWTPAQRKVLEEAIVKNGLTPAMEAYSKNAWWTNCHHNWNQVCNGGIGVGALAIADQEPKLCGEILQNAVKNLPLAMVNYAPDGAWGEGPGYWGYATQYNVAILAALDSALGKDFGLSKTPGFSLAGDMPIYSNTPTGGSFNFADAPDEAIASSTMFWLAGKFDAPRFARERLGQLEGAAGGAGGKGAFSAEPLDLLWFNPKWADVSVTPAPLARYFPHVEMMTARSAWGDRKAAFLGFKAGSNAVNHSHLDLGSFIYETRGQRFFIDLGPDDYNLPDYFGKARWDYYRLRAEGHNTLVINPDGRPDQDPKAEAKITRFDAQAPQGKAWELTEATATADLTPAYADHGAKRVVRTVKWEKSGEVTVTDDVELNKAGEIWWFGHTGAEVALTEDGRAATLSQGGVKLAVTLLQPAEAKFVVMDAKRLATSPHPAGQDPNDGSKKLNAAEYGFIKVGEIPQWGKPDPKHAVRKLAIHLTDATAAHIEVRMTPAGE